jgi:quercetin dioxygenase-like cupin family protein
MTPPAFTAGVTPAGQGLDGITWNILGQTYKPVSYSETSFAFDTLFPPGTFVPPHIHTNQDEFIRVLEGEFELVLEGQKASAKAGDLIRLPMGQSHGIFNNSGQAVRALFWVSPTQKLFELFSRIHNVADPAEVVRISATCDVTFLPPPG